jgi:hypothetical protein
MLTKLNLGKNIVFAFKRNVGCPFVYLRLRSSTPRLPLDDSRLPPRLNPVCVRVVRHRPHIARVARAVRTRCRAPFPHVVCCPRTKSREPARHSGGCHAWFARVVRVDASFAHIARAVSRVARCERAIFNRSMIITHVD